MLVHIGLDDTDSRSGECTTHISTRIISRLGKNIKFIDYPNLIRLNPNVPWKTKGNAAICLRFYTNNPQHVFNEACKIVTDHASREAHPGVVLYKGDVIPDDLRRLYLDALTGIVSRKRVRDLLNRFNIMSKGGLGIVGALASIGADLNIDYTYELLVYRHKEMWGKKRKINYESVMNMNEVTKPYTFNNVDPDKKKILASPNGPDPVLIGIRGEEPHHLINALNLLDLGESIESFMIFRSNQGTGVHLLNELRLDRLKSFDSGYVYGYVAKKARIEQGGHVYFRLYDFNGGCNCAVYQPTGNLRSVALSLLEEDYVRVAGGVRKPSSKHSSVLNVEEINVISLINAFEYKNPICKDCGRRMTSLGKMQGYDCKICSFRDREAKKIKIPIKRTINMGTYLPPPRAHRHLTKPNSRKGLEKKSYFSKMNQKWFYFSNELVKPISDLS